MTEIIFLIPTIKAISLKYPAISGKIDSQNSQFQNIRGKGPIPEGFYDVRQSKYESIDIINRIIGFAKRGEWPGLDMSWGTERVWLKPQDESKMYGRDNFSIHGGLNPESAGCIDLVGNAPTFFNFFKSLGSDAVLQVDYGSGGYNGLNNPLTKGSSKITIEQIYADQGKNLNEIKPIKNFLDASKSALEKKLKMSIADEDLVKKLNNYDIKSGDYIKESKDKKIIKDNKENNEKLEDKIILAEADGIGKFSIIDDSDYFTLSDNTTALLSSIIKITQTAKDATVRFAEGYMKEVKDVFTANEVILSEAGKKIFDNIQIPKITQIFLKISFIHFLLANTIKLQKITP